MGHTNASAGDAQVFKKYSQMKLQMKREALEKINRQASEMAAQDTPALCRSSSPRRSFKLFRPDFDSKCCDCNTDS
jgi:hypothetical protein